MRKDGRKKDEIRKMAIQPDFIIHPHGSVLIETGNTKVICTAFVEEKVPGWMEGKGRGWITAEYSMLPGATDSRGAREAVKGKQSGRTQEIQRLIGRSLRASVDLGKLGERTVRVDCDVIQADGGTRTASVTGGCCALVLALQRLMKKGILAENPFLGFVAAVSVGKVDGGILLDLPYEEDSRAETDMNVVMAWDGSFIEIQGTGEEAVFSRRELDEMLDAAEKGIREIFEVQKRVLGDAE